MRLFSRTLAAVFAVLLCMGQAAPSRPLAATVRYTLTPIMADGALRAVQFDLRFHGEADGDTELRLPSFWGGQDELWRGVSDLAVVSGAAMRAGEGPASRVLTHRPNAHIHVRYRIIQDTPSVPTGGRSNPYRPIVQPGYFHLIGGAALVVPAVADATPVRLRPRNMPRGWTFASDLEHASLSLGRANASVIVGGDFRVLSAPDPSIRVAIRGQWAFTDAQFAAEAGEIIAGHRRFWGDQAAPYLVTLISLETREPGSTSIGGTGLQDAFAMFVTPNAERGQITRILTHESLHTWIPGLIGGMPDAEAAERGGYWLSEGFTDFYTARALVREGVWTPEQFAASLNEMLAAYARSPVRAHSNDRIRADFWNDEFVQKLPYQRGHLLATIWDARLRALGPRDLDDAVLEMRARARAGDPLKAPEMFPVVMDSLGLDVRADIARHVEAGAPILLPEDVFSPCGLVETREAPNFHRGFDIQATRDNHDIIAGVVRDGPAYAAGMRDGMVLLRREAGEIGDAELEIAYVVRDGETERTIRYMPRGPGSFTMQRLVLDGALQGEQLARCISVLGGA